MQSIRITGAAFSFDGKALFEGVTVTLKAGECLGLLGHNGSGKTTFLDCLFGLRRFTRGNVELEAGEKTMPIGRWSTSRLVRSGFRRVFQKSPGLPARPVNELLRATATPTSWGSPQKTPFRGENHTCRNKLQVLVSDFAGPSELLSFGQVRLSLTAFALASNGQVLLLDEPFEGLSEANRNSLIGALTEAMDDGAILVVADHDRTRVEALATQTLELGNL